MRKHFLILMLLALLPFTAWALAGVNVTAGEYTVTINQQVMFTATEPNVTQVQHGTAGPVQAERTGLRYQTIGKKVNAVSADGLYYLEVTVTGDQKALYVPFYVSTGASVEKVWNESTFNTSLASGFLKKYYEAKPFCDIWWSYTGGGQILYPGQYPTANAGVVSGTAYNWYDDVDGAIAWGNQIFSNYAGTYNLAHTWAAFSNVASNVPGYGFVVPETLPDGNYNVLITNGDNSHTWDGANGPMTFVPGKYSWTNTAELDNDWGLNVDEGDAALKFHVYPTDLPNGVQADVVSDVEITLDPNVINVLYPDNVGGVVPAVKASDFSISGTYPTGITTDAQAKASLVASEILKIQTVGGAAIPELTGSVKYYFDIDQEKLAESVWAGAAIHVAKNGDLNVIARPLNHETVFITADPTDAAYNAGTYSYEFNATERQPKPFVTIGAYDPAVTTNRLVEGTDFAYSWSFNKNVNNVAEDPTNAETAGVPTVTITALPGTGYTGSTTFEFGITPRAFNNVTINGLTAKTYNRGQALTQDFTVKDTQLNYDMVAGRDYDPTTVWANNVNATPENPTDEQKAYVKVTPFGNYKTVDPNDAAYGRFIINRKNINDADIVFKAVESKVYNYGAELVQTDDALTLQWKWNTGTAEAPVYQTLDIPAIFDYTYANNKNVGTATITAKILAEVPAALADAAKNYTYTTPGKITTFQIKPRKLTDVAGLTIAVTASEAVYKEGDPVTPTLVVTRNGAYNPEHPEYVLQAGIDYEVPADTGWVNNINATPATPTDAQKAKVWIVGKGNYAAINEQAKPVSVYQLFTISKKEVILTGVGPQDAKPYGTPEEDFGFTYTYNLTKITTPEAFVEKFGGYVEYKPYTNPAQGDPQLINTDFNALAVGTYKVRATWKPYDTTPLTQEQIAARETAQLPYDTEDQINDRVNYDLTMANFELGTFTIDNAALTIVPLDAEKIYGVANDPALSFEVRNSNNVIVNVDWEQTGAVKPVLTRAAGSDAGDYVISVSNTPVLPNFTLTYSATANFEIKPFPITITANDQTIMFGSTPNLNAEYNQMVKRVDGEVESYDPYITTVSITPSQLADESVIDRGVNGLGLTLTWDKTVVGNNGEYVDALVPVITSQNFAATIVKGKLTIKNDAPAITLVRVAKAKFDTEENTAASYVEQYAGKHVTVNIKFNDADDFNTLKANKWYAMILPFQTTAKQISDAFGYAIVDLLNTANTNTHRTLFSLHMSTEVIPANTPFLIKVWDTIDMNETGVTFNGVDIVAPEAYDEIAVSDAAGNKFIGSYTGINGLGAFKPEYSGHVTWWSLNQGAEYDNNAVTASNTAYLRQLSAFNYIPGDLAAHEIVIEELGGGTTVIRNLNADAQTFSGEGWYNLNGVKLQSVPAEKGVYIHNGKKIVIK